MASAGSNPRVRFVVPEEHNDKEENANTLISNEQTSQSESPGAGVATIENFFYYSATDRKWHAIRSSDQDGPPKQLRSSFTLITWNIDFNSTDADLRAGAVLSHLRRLLTTSQDDSAESMAPTVVLLQEVADDVVKVLAEHEWVRENFYITDVDGAHGKWQHASYGTVTLVDRRLKLKNHIRLGYNTEYQRDCLFVDIECVRLSDSEVVTIRVGNTHLESLISKPPKRPNQLKLAAVFAHDKNVYAGIVAGDMNPIEDFDANLPKEADMDDAWLLAGNKEEDAKGHTWGYQTENNIYQPRRFDKILLTPGKLKLEAMDVIGAGEKVALHNVFLSDHYGVMGNVRVV
jgi:tyrosyl-DNA phosphodiesterase 2